MSYYFISCVLSACGLSALLTIITAHTSGAFVTVSYPKSQFYVLVVEYVFLLLCLIERTITM